MKKTDGETALGRGIRLGKLGFGLVGSYVGYQAQNFFLSEERRSERKSRFHREASQRVAGELGNLKGPVMKLGQLLSMQSKHFSSETLSELAALQMKAPGMHPSLARAQFKSSVGKYPEEVFLEFEPEPFAAASLGQVHRAVGNDGEKLAVKIQYPAIRSAIENDFKLIRSAALPGRLTGHIPTALFDEVQRGIMEETDYVKEANNLEFFKHGLRKLDFVAIPSVTRKLSTDRVLTMSFIEGEPLQDFLRRKPTQAARNQLGARLTELFETQMFHLKALHADSHPGNYLFQRDGGIGLVDFGCVKRFSHEPSRLQEFYDKRMWREGGAREQEFLTLMCGQKADLAKARKILPTLEKWLDLRCPVGSEFIFGDTDPKVQAREKEIRILFTRQVLQNKLINPEYAFLGRAEMGIVHLLEELGAVVNVTQIIRRVVAAAR